MVNKSKSNTGLVVLIIVLTILLITASVLLVQQIKKTQELAETLQVIQQDNIPEVITRAQSVLRGEEIVVDGNDALEQYSCSSMKEYFPDISTVELTDFKILYAHIEDDTGEIGVSYKIRYLNQSGKVLTASGIGSPPARWTIEKQNGQWSIVNIWEHP